MYIPDKGDIVSISLTSDFGEDIKCRRSALIISTKKYSKLTDLALVCPVIHGEPEQIDEREFLVPVRSTTANGDINPLQIHTFSYKERGMKFIGRIQQKSLDEVIAIINEIVNAHS